MREAIIIAVVIGFLFFAATAAMTAVAIKYATPSLLWDLVLWGGVAGMIASLSTLAVFISAQVTGRPFWGPAICGAVAVCMGVAAVAWHFSSEDNEQSYVYFRVQTDNPPDADGNFPIWVGGGPNPTTIFENIVVWFSPATANGTASSPAYWSIGAALKVPLSELHGGPYMYGRAIPAGKYRIEYIGKSDGKGFGFVEILLIGTYNDEIVQLFDVWKDQERGPRKLVYSNSDERSASLRDERLKP